MNTIKQRKFVNISEILNYQENPRHEIAKSESETIKKLINKVGSQYMYNLIKDIYVNGLLGYSLPTLVFDSNVNKYIVYEGNRRVAGIKILENPEILNSIDNSLKSRIEQMKIEEVKNYESDIFCYITSEEEALIIMERAHSGEDKGRGLKAWTPKEKGVFTNRIKDKKAIEFLLAEYNTKYLNEDLTSKIGYTTIKRFFNNREIKKALGLDTENPSNIDKDMMLKVNYLIDTALIESKKRNLALTRLFNRAREIEDFFIPLIKNEPVLDAENGEEIETTVKTPSEIAATSIKEDDKLNEKKTDQDNQKLKLTLNKTASTYNTNQTINLEGIIKREPDYLFKPNLLDITSENLVIEKYIIQPTNISGIHNITFTYYFDESLSSIYWQDSLEINLKTKNRSHRTEDQKVVLSKSFVEKHINSLNFEHADKIKSVMLFLSNETKDGKYAPTINIITRMFLEYSFRLYASKILNYNNEDIEKFSSLSGLIGHCCTKIETQNPETFVKHIKRGKQDSLTKVEILQKSIHYFDVTISNDDVQVMLKNLGLYLEVVYSNLSQVK